MTPISSSIRLIFMIGFFLAACMYIAYSASMVTNLSTETIPVKNSKDLADSSIEIFADKWLPMTHKVMEVYVITVFAYNNNQVENYVNQHF